VGTNDEAIARAGGQVLASRPAIYEDAIYKDAIFLWSVAPVRLYCLLGFFDAPPNNNRRELSMHRQIERVPSRHVPRTATSPSNPEPARLRAAGDEGERIAAHVRDAAIGPLTRVSLDLRAVVEIATDDHVRARIARSIEQLDRALMAMRRAVWEPPQRRPGGPA